MSISGHGQGCEVDVGEISSLLATTTGLCSSLAEAFPTTALARRRSNLTGGSAAAFVFYGPKANVTLSGYAGFYGSVIVNAYTDTGGAALHFVKY